MVLCNEKGRVVVAETRIKIEKKRFEVANAEEQRTNGNAKLLKPQRRITCNRSRTAKPTAERRTDFVVHTR